MDSSVPNLYNNAIKVAFYPYYGIENDNESLLENYSYLVSPIRTENDDVYQLLKEKNTDINIITFEDFNNFYNSNVDYKNSILTGCKEAYKYNLKQYFKKLIPDAEIFFSDTEELWCASPSNLGYFIISKKEN